MANFAETIANNPPRLVVMFRRDDNGAEQYQWGVVGNIPILTLIGYITNVQHDLVSGAWIPSCQLNPGEVHPRSLVIVWNQQDSVMSHFVDPEIPVNASVGMLETIKSVLVDSRMAQHSAINKVQLYGPDGTPYRS